MTVALILAAGSGRRLGGPKALLAWPHPDFHRQEVPLAVAHAEARLGAECSTAVIVTRSNIIPWLLPYLRPGIKLLSSDAPDELGPAGSIACAAAHTRAWHRVLIIPVDTPPAGARTIECLLARLDKGTPLPLAARPRCNGKAGHPVALRADVLERYRSAMHPPPLRDCLRSLGDRCVDVDIEDCSVLDDIDTPEDALRLLGQAPRFLNVRRN